MHRDRTQALVNRWPIQCMCRLLRRTYTSNVCSVNITWKMSTTHSLSARDAAAVLSERSESLFAANQKLAAALGIPYSLDGKYVVMTARDEVLLEAYMDAFEAARECGCSPAKIAIFVGIHQQLFAALTTGATSWSSKSAPALGEVSGVKAIRLLESASAVTLQPARKAGLHGVATEADAADMFETLMRAHVAGDFADPDTDNRFTLGDLKALVKHVHAYGFIRHMQMYRHVLMSPERHHEAPRLLMVETPMIVPPLSEAKQV